MFSVVAHEELSPQVHKMTVKAPAVAEKAKPGQFIILIVDEKGERVPFTMSGWDVEAGTVDFVYVEVGKTTRQLALLNPGDELAHFVGPLGRPAEVEHFGNVVAIVSGYGIAAMVPVLKALEEKENRITTILQAPDRERVFGEDELSVVSDRMIMAIGQNGEDMTSSTTRPLRKLLADLPRNPIQRIIVMGSICLMRVISEMTRPYSHQDHGAPHPAHGGRHGHVRRLPVEREGRSQPFRLRARSRVRRPRSGRMGRDHGAALHLRRRKHTAAGVPVPRMFPVVVRPPRGGRGKECVR